MFLDCGYSPLLFSQLSPAEIVDMIDSYNRQQDVKQKQYTNRIKDQIRLLDGAVNILAYNIAAAISGDEYKRLEDAFPDLFTGEKPDKVELSAEMQLYKAQRLDHAYRVNKRRMRQRS